MNGALISNAPAAGNAQLLRLRCIWKWELPTPYQITITGRMLTTCRFWPQVASTLNSLYFRFANEKENGQSGQTTLRCRAIPTPRVEKGERLEKSGHGMVWGLWLHIVSCARQAQTIKKGMLFAMLGASPQKEDPRALRLSLKNHTFIEVIKNVQNDVRSIRIE